MLHRILSCSECAWTFSKSATRSRLPLLPFPFLMLPLAHFASIFFVFNYPWKCPCFLEARLRPGLTIRFNESPATQTLEYQISYSEPMANEAALSFSPCGRQCGTGKGLELSGHLIRVPVPAHLCLTKTFNLGSLVSKMQILILFSWVCLWGSNEIMEMNVEDTIQMQGTVMLITKATLSLPLSPEQISNSCPLTRCCWKTGTNFHILCPWVFIRKANTGLFLPLLLNKSVYHPVNSNISVACYREKRSPPRKMCHSTGNLGLICTREPAHGNLFGNDKVL